MIKKMIGIVILLAMVITGCSNDRFAIRSDNPPDQGLSVYLPTAEYEFLGEGGYYHYYKMLKTEELEDRILVTISGEVKDNSKSTTKNDHGFQTEIWIDSEKMVQKSTGKMLNESDFDRLILLKTPIAEDATWEFDTYDKVGEKHVVTGRIIDIDDETGIVEVEYTTEAGNYEKRTFMKNHGTTSFIKQLAYKDAVTYTGYHMNQVEAVQNEEQDGDLKYDGLDVVEIDYELYQLIDGFNIRWVNYIKNIDQALMELIDMDSNAYLKVVAIKEEPIELDEYLGFKPYKIEIMDDVILICVMEKFLVGGDRTHYNTICYEVIKENDGIFISDFYSTNP